MATVKFFIRHKDKKKSAIRAIVSFFGAQYPVAIGVSANPRFWNQSKCRSRTEREYPEARHINERLDEWEKLLKDVAKGYEVKIMTPTLSDFREAIEHALKVRSGYTENEKSPYVLEFAEAFKQNCSKSIQTKKNYGVAIEHLSDYEKKFKTRLKFEHITSEFYGSLRNHLLQQTYEKNGEKRHYAKNTIGSVIKNLLVFFNEARRSGCTNMYLAGIDIYTIMGFSGHTTEKSFRKYIKIKQEENAQRFVEHPFFNRP
ncbi:MAG: site-specific integrase [Prevotellaceae bacterium]|jgi:hypothetical protein|nr:site-specific integrase [Prevotellaceae bacterium]